MNKIKNLRPESGGDPEKLMQMVSQIEKEKASQEKQKEDPLSQFLNANLQSPPEEAPEPKPEASVKLKRGSDLKLKTDSSRLSTDKTPSEEKSPDAKWKKRLARGWKESPKVNEDFPLKLGKRVNEYQISNLNARGEVDLIASSKKKKAKAPSASESVDEGSIFEVERVERGSPRRSRKAGDREKASKGRGKKKKLRKIRSLAESERSSQRGSAQRPRTGDADPGKAKASLRDGGAERGPGSVDFIEVEKVDASEALRGQRKQPRGAPKLPRATSELATFLDSPLFAYATRAEESLQIGFEQGFARNPFRAWRLSGEGPEKAALQCQVCDGLLVQGSACLGCAKRVCRFCFFEQIDLPAILRSRVSKEEVIDEESGFLCSCGHKEAAPLEEKLRTLIESNLT